MTRKVIAYLNLLFERNYNECCLLYYREEWEWLRRLSINEATSQPSLAQCSFQDQLVKATKQLLESLGECLIYLHAFTFLHSDYFFS